MRKWKTDDVLRDGHLSKHAYDFYGDDTVAIDRFPGLKFHLPLDEGQGGSFTDSVGGLVWSFDEEANTHSVPNAITHSSVTGEDESLANVVLSGNIPAPGSKVSILIAVFGATEDYNIDNDFTYLRFGVTDAGNSSQFVLSMNSKDVAGNNCAKNHDASSGPFVTWEPVMTPCVQAIVTEYHAGILTNDYYVNERKYTGRDTSAVQMDYHGASLNLSAYGSAVQTVYNIQYWHFNTIPTDIVRALIWTRDASLFGNKNPYPGWVGTT